MLISHHNQITIIMLISHHNQITIIMLIFHHYQLLNFRTDIPLEYMQLPGAAQSVCRSSFFNNK